MGSADEVNIQASELNRTMKVRPRNCILPGQMCTEVIHPKCFSMLRIWDAHSDSAHAHTLKIVCYLLQVIHRFYQRYTGLELERIEEETDRDNFMSPKQAQDLGIIDGIILSSDLITPAATATAVAA